MKHLITFLLLITVSLAFGQPERKLLKKAYKKQSDEMLQQFFQNWQNEIKPINAEALSRLSPIQQESYKAFKAFYRPDRIDLLGGSEMGTDLYQEVKYIIVQQEIDIHTSEKVYYTEAEKEDYAVAFINANVTEDSLRQAWLRRDEDGKLSKEVMESLGSTEFLLLDIESSLVESLTNFRPAIQIENKTSVYLSEKYSQILTKFLGKKNRAAGKGDLMNPAAPKGKSARRKQFLDPYIKIWQGHWGGYWQLHSFPVVTSITFDKNMTFAKVDFRMVYEGGEAILKKENGKWQIVTAYRTWIE